MQPITYTLEQLCDIVAGLELRLVEVERAARDNNNELHGLITSIDRVNAKVDKVIAALEPLEPLFQALLARQKTWREIMGKAREEFITWSIRGAIATGVYIIGSGAVAWMKDKLGIQ